MPVPKLRFKKFKDKWKSYKIEDRVGDSIGGGTPSTKIPEYWKGSIPWISSSDLEQHRLFNVIPTRFITQTAIENSSTHLIPKNSIAVVTRVGVGKLAIIDQDYCTSQDFQSLIELKDDIYFFTYLLHKELMKLSLMSQGTSIKGITKTELINLNLTIPSKEEQQKIGLFFSKLDTKIQLQQEKIDLLKEQKKGYMQKIFSQKLRFKDEKGQEFAEWKLSNLGEIAEIVGGGTPSTQNQSFWSGKIPWISSSDLTKDNYYGINFERHINEYAINSSATHRIPSNSIAIVTRVGLGKIAYVTREYCTSQDFQNLIDFEENPVFLVHAIAFELNKIITMSQGTSIKGITKKELESINIYLPSKEEQNKIGAFLKAMDNRIHRQQEKINLLEKQKQAFMQQMFI